MIRSRDFVENQFNSWVKAAGFHLFRANKFASDGNRLPVIWKKPAPPQRRTRWCRKNEMAKT
jgi:hypothetical protein